MNTKTCVAACLLASSNSFAVPILDQGNDVRGVGASLAEGFAYVGQTVTAGVTGALVAVEIHAIDRADFTIPWVLDILRVTSGAVSGEVLSSELTTLPSPDGIDVGFQRIQFTHPAFLAAGDSFAITLHPHGIEGRPGLLAGSWGGGLGDPYLRGEFIVGFTATTLTAGMPAGVDLNFRTFVEPVPEPASYWLILMAFAALMAAGARDLRREATRCLLRG